MEDDATSLSHDENETEDIEEQVMGELYNDYDSQGIEDEAMEEEDYTEEAQVDGSTGGERDEIVVNVSYEAKLRELLCKLSSKEVVIYTAASKEFIKLLRGETGGEFLRQYVHASPKLLELKKIWKVGKEKTGSNLYVLSLLTAVLDQPDGKYESSDTGRLTLSRRLDELGKSIVLDKLEDVYDELKSGETKRRNAGLLLMAAIVRRGVGLASLAAEKFDFKSLVPPKQAQNQKKRVVNKGNYSVRKSEIEFGMSFLECGNPRLLRWILQEKELYHGILRDLGRDDEETIVYVLSVLRDKVLTPDSLVPPSLRSVLFGSGTLEQLALISGNPIGGPSADIAHEILVMVCTDPLNGLIPDLNAKYPLKGNRKRLLDLMKKLNAKDIGHHRELLLTIVNGRPSLGSAYMDEFSFNLEPCSSPNWLAAVSLVTDLVSLTNTSLYLSFSALWKHDPPTVDSPEVQCMLNCIVPRAFSRVVINRGLQHDNIFVKHGCARFLLEALKSLDNFISAIECASHHNDSVAQKWLSLKQGIQDAARAMLPDPQVVLKLLTEMRKGDLKSCNGKLKRARSLEKSPELNSVKKSKIDRVDNEIDILISGLSTNSDNAMSIGRDNISDKAIKDVLENGAVPTKLMDRIWGLQNCSVIRDEPKDAEIYLHSKVTEIFTIYLRTMPNALEASYDFFKELPSNPFVLSITQQQSLLPLLVEYIGWCPESRIPFRPSEEMYKHLRPLINLLICSPIKGVRDQAYTLARAAMLSTGAFDSDPREIDAWFMFLPGCIREESPMEDQGLKVSGDLFEVVVLFFCDAVSSVGTNLYKYHNNVRCQLSKLNDFGDVKPHFSPFIFCILDKCIRLLGSNSKKKLCEKSMISIYVCNTLCFLLQTQVKGGLLPDFIDVMLAARLGNLSSVDDDSGEFDFEWGPLKYLWFFSQNLHKKQPCTSLCSIWSKPPTSSDHHFVKTLDKIKEMINHCEGALGEVDAIFSSSIVCTSPSNILANFPKVITASQLLLKRPFPFLSNLFFLHCGSLPDVAKVWPDIFFSSLELANSVIRPDARTDSYSDREIASVALGYYLKEAPFFVIFPLIFRLASSDLLNASKLVDILKVKLSQGSFDDSVVSLRLILFWVHQMQLPHGDNQPGELELRLEICFICIKYVLAQVLPVVADFDTSTTTRLPSLVSYIQEVAKIIFHHPVVSLSLHSPLCCNTALTHGSLSDDFEDFISSAKLSIRPMEHNILDMLKTVADHLLALCNGQHPLPKFQAAANKQLLKDFNDIVQRVVSSFKEKFAFCIRNNVLIPLRPSYAVLNTLIHYVSPFKLLELVRWMFGEVDQTYKVGEKSVMVNGLSIGCYFADNALDLISSCLHHMNGKALTSSVLWDVKWASCDVSLIEEVLYKIIELATSFKLEWADKCLIKALNTMYVQSQPDVLPLIMSVSRVIMSMPTKILSHCINETSPTKVKLLFLLTEFSPLHMTLFGKVFLSTMSSDFTSRRLASKDNHMCAPSDKELIILLPVALSYLNFSITKFGDQNLKCLEAITSIYSKTLLVGFLNWKSFVSRKIFLEEHGELLPASAPELVNLFNCSLLGKVIYMLKYYFAFNGESIDKEKKMDLFHSVYPLPSAPDELLECDVSEIKKNSTRESLRSIIRIIAKISFSRLLLFPDDSFIKSFTTEAGGGLQEMSSSKLSFLKILVRTWKNIVKRFPLVTEKSKDSMSTPCSLLFRHLEVFVLRNIAELSMVMQGELVQLDSFSFPESFFKSSLRYRFADPTTLKVLRGVLLSLHEGKCSYHVLVELLQTHSQFVPYILCSDSISGSDSAFQCGTLSKPISSILSSHFLSTDPGASDAKHSLEVSLSHSRKLELIKLLRVLYHLSSCQNKYISAGEGISINSGELLSLLLSCYGATMCEIDLEIFNLMNEFVSTEGSYCPSIAEMDYLWGDAVSKVRLGKKLKSSNDTVDGETSKEYRKRQFRENFRIDPNLILATVLNFPYDRVAFERPPTPKKLLEDNIMDSLEEPYAGTNRLRQYDPVFLLRFSIHGLSMGYFESLEFAGLGLLALSIMSTSSPDQGIRKLGYEVLERFKMLLEELRKAFKDHANSKFKVVSLLLLLLLYLQNGITEEGQRIPSVTAMLAAEASLVLLNPSNKINFAIKEVLCKRKSKQLICDPEGKYEALTNLERIPLFHLLYGRSSIKLNEHNPSKEKENVKTNRLWILRLCYAGLVLEDDADIYEKKYSQMLSFYSSSFSDNESKKLILQIVKKSVKLPNLALYLVKRNGLISWLSSVFCFLHGNLFADDSIIVVMQMTTCLEIVNDIISQRTIMELPLKSPKNPVKGADLLEGGVLEQLSELVSHLYKFLLSSLKTIQNVSLVNIILQILVTSLSIFQKQDISKPHLNISHKSLFQLCEVIVDEFGNAQSCHSAELVIRAVLTHPPPIVRTQMDSVEFTRFLMLAIPVALKSHNAVKSAIQPSSFSRKQSSIEGTLISTLLRWVSSSVVLGKKICKTNTSSLETASSESLQWLLGNLIVSSSKGSEEDDNSEWKEDGCRNNVSIAATIMYLQQLLHGINCKQVLRSVVSSLCLLLLSGDDDSTSTGVISLVSEQGKTVASLCSKIRCPVEANPDWRWSFSHELEDCSSAEQTDSQKVDEYNACQSLLLIFRNALRSNSLDLPFMSYQDLMESGVFEWEKNTFTTE